MSEHSVFAQSKHVFSGSGSGVGAVVGLTVGAVVGAFVTVVPAVVGKLKFKILAIFTFLFLGGTMYSQNLPNPLPLEGTSVHADK